MRRPPAVSTGQVGVIEGLTRRVDTDDSRKRNPVIAAALTLSEYRTGNYTAAVTRAADVLAAQRIIDPPDITVAIVLAMGQYRLGKEAEALFEGTPSGASGK